MSERTPEQDEAFKLHYNLKTLSDKVTEYTTLLTEKENLKRRLEKDDKKTQATPLWEKRIDEIDAKMQNALSLAVQAKKDLKEMICNSVTNTSCCAETKPAKKKVAKS